MLPALAVIAAAAAAANGAEPGQSVVSRETYASGTPSRRTGLITSDGPIIARSRTYGCESDAVTLAALANAGPRDTSRLALQDDSIEVMGGLCAGSFFNTYGGLDSVATFFSNQAPAPIDVDRDAHFDPRHVFLSRPLSRAQVAAVAPGMVVRTNPLPVAGRGARSPFQAVIDAVSPDGRTLTVQQWAQPGDPSGASVGRSPQGYGGASGPYTAIIDLVLNVYGNNTIVSLAPGSGQDLADRQDSSERAEIGYELLMNNGYRLDPARTRGLVDPYFDVPLDVGFHVSANGDGSVGFSVDDGADPHRHPTAFDYGFTARGARFAGFDAVTVGAISPRFGFLAETPAAETPWAFAYAPQNAGHPGTLRWGVAADGTTWAPGFILGGAALGSAPPLASIRGGGGGVAGQANSAILNYAAAAHDFADPSGTEHLRIAASAAGVTLSTNTPAITVTAPLQAAGGLRPPLVAARALPSACVTGEIAYGHGIRAGDEASGAGSGAPVYCDDQRHWRVLGTGLAPTY